MFKNKACVLLAGGKGSRLGYINKLNTAFGDSSFGGILMPRLEKSGMPCILSVANYEIMADDPWIIVKDEMVDAEYIGPLGGIKASLESAKGMGLKGSYVVSCDMPLFDISLFEKMDSFTDNYQAVIWKTNDGKEHYSCGYYSVDLLETIDKNISAHKYSLKTLIHSSDYICLDTGEYDIEDKWLTNINDKQTLDAFINKL